MQLWYSIIGIFPFEWTQYSFMKNAMLAILLISPIFGLLGTMTVNNKMAFFSDSLGHSALTGIGLGVLIGITNPLWSIVAFSLLFSYAVIGVKNSVRTSTDTIIGVFSSASVALGIVILSYKSGFSKYSSFLVGDLLSISTSDILLLFIVLAIVLIAWMTIFNKLMLVSINILLARSRGINTRTIELIFTSLIAIIVAVSIRWVGLLIINSLLVLPAAAARNVARNMRQYSIISVAIAFVSGVSGLIVSYYLDTASGATIVLIAALFFALTFMFRKRFD